MDNLTHSLTGLALARAGLRRYSPRAVLLLVLAANIPDLDMLSWFAVPLRNLEIHRGYTHSLLCLPLMAVVPVLVVAAVYRQRLPWLKAWLLCCVGVLSHLLIDWTNDYGTRLLLPFSSEWFSLDINYLYDFVILVILLFASLWPFLGSLVSDEIGDRRRALPGRGVAIFALAFFLLYDAGRFLLHQRAVAQLDSRIYEGAEPLRTAAFPRPGNPLAWDGLVETQGGYHLYDLNSLENFDPAGGVLYYKPLWTQAFDKAAATRPFRSFLYFARYPIWEETKPEEPGRTGRLEVTDFRFSRPGGSSFQATAEVDATGAVDGAAFSFGAMRPTPARTR